MADERCSCGFAEPADETMTDHLLEAFAPDDSRAADGVIHEEWAATLACSCGVVAAAPAELDRHFLAIIIPADPVDRNGLRHERIR
jgi:hypothetical protein